MNEKANSISILRLKTNGEKLYNITNDIQDALNKILDRNTAFSAEGTFILFLPHTSAGLLITEGHEPSAVEDLQKFFQHLAPRHLPFIQHTTEGPDDSPSHMKSSLIPNQLTVFVHKGKLHLGQWQAIFLAEFRDHTKTREIWAKYIPDRNN